MASGFAPFLVGSLVEKHGLASGFMLTAAVVGKLIGIHIAGRILKWSDGEASIIGWLLQSNAGPLF